MGEGWNSNYIKCNGEFALKAVVICHRIPYPPNKGEKIRSYNLLRCLCRYCDVSLFFLIDHPGDVEYVANLRSLAKFVAYHKINPKLKKALSSLAFLRESPISVRYFYSPRLQREVDRTLEDAPDLIFCSSSPTAEYVFRSSCYKNALKHTKLVMDLIDVDSEKWLGYAKRSKGPLGIVYRMEARYLLRYEARISKEFDQIFLVSEAERNLFLRRTRATNVSVLPNGVDLHFFSPNHKSGIGKIGPILVFTGAMDYWPNVDGVIWFAKEIFPKIRETFPSSKFFIVGRDPTKEVKELASDPQITVTGFVEDVRDYISLADVCVVPLRLARGIQNKVLEAMAMGKPVIATSEALRGIEAIPERDVLVSDDGSGFARQVIRVLSDSALGKELGKNARKCVETKYSWEASFAILSRKLASLLTA